MSSVGAATGAAAGCALHDADDGLRAFAHRDHDVADGLLAGQALLHVTRRGAGAVFQVQPGAIAAARTLQHHHADVGAVFQALEVGAQRIGEAGIERIQPLGPVHRQPGDAIALVDQQGGLLVAHHSAREMTSFMISLVPP